MRGLLPSGLLLLTIAHVLCAQTYPNGPYYGNNPYYQGGDPRVRPQAPADYGFSLFERVQADLERAEDNSYGHRERFDHARKEIRDFQKRLERGRFDKGELDEAISATQHVVDSNAVRERDRSVLLNDLARMREFRATRGGAYDGRGYGYR
jgi:hypothetical protein